VFGAENAVDGKVIKSELDADNHALILFVQPVEPIAREEFQKPAIVSIDTGFLSMSSSVERNK